MHTKAISAPNDVRRTTRNHRPNPQRTTTTYADPNDGTNTDFDTSQEYTHTHRCQGTNARRGKVVRMLRNVTLAPNLLGPRNQKATPNIGVARRASTLDVAKSNRRQRQVNTAVTPSALVCLHLPPAQLNVQFAALTVLGASAAPRSSQRTTR